jgi:hypothetical protein
MGVIFEARSAGHGFAFTASTTREDVKRCEFTGHALRAAPLNFDPPAKVAGFSFDADLPEFDATCPIGQTSPPEIDN